MYKLHIIITISIISALRITEVVTKESKRDFMLNTTKKMITDLEEFVNYERRSVDIFANHLQRLKEDYKEASSNFPKYLNSQANNFTIIKRLTADLEFIEMISNSSKIYRRDVSLRYPRDLDLDGAIESLRNYIISKKPSTTTLSYKMTSSDCFVVADSLWISPSNCSRAALEWFLEAYEKLTMKIPEAYPFRYRELADRITFCYNAVGDSDGGRTTLSWLQHLMDIYPEAVNKENKILEAGLKYKIASEDAYIAALTAQKARKMADEEIAEHRRKIHELDESVKFSNNAITSIFHFVGLHDIDREKNKRRARIDDANEWSAGYYNKAVKANAHAHAMRENYNRVSAGK